MKPPVDGIISMGMTGQGKSASARTFVDTVDLPSDRAVLSGGKWLFSCGLEMVDTSIKDTEDDHYVTKNAAIMRLAHTRHHNDLDTDFIKSSRGEEHDPRPSLYFMSRIGNQGSSQLVDAWCSCGYADA